MPRFDWNLWFASLGSWSRSPIVLQTEKRLSVRHESATRSPGRALAILVHRPRTKRATGRWWRRKLIGLYAPVLARAPGDRFAVIQMPGGMLMQR